MKRIIVAAILVLMLAVGVSLAGNGGESKFDTRWNITVINGCNDTERVYKNCFVTSEGLTYIAFIPNQMRSGVSNGKQVRLTTNSCTSVVMEEAD